MKTTNRNRLTVVATRIGIPLCLALTCFSEQAAAGIIAGTASDENSTVTYNPGNNTSTSYYPLPVGPGAGGGSKINPNDYGMCGLLSLSGAFDPSTAARIVVAPDGYYAVYRAWLGASKSGGLKVGWTCVRFTDFTGLPAISNGETFEPPPVGNGGGAATQKLIGGYADACIWAGISGDLSSSQGHSAYVYAQYGGTGVSGATLDTAQAASPTTLLTYAFCNAFKGFPAWNYYMTSNWLGELSTGGLQIPVPLGKKNTWCYMDGVGVTFEGTFTHAGLGISSGPAEDYYYDVGSGSQFVYNCLPLKQ